MAIDLSRLNAKIHSGNTSGSKGSKALKPAASRLLTFLYEEATVTAEGAAELLKVTTKEARGIIRDAQGAAAAQGALVWTQSTGGRYATSLYGVIRADDASPEIVDAVRQVASQFAFKGETENARPSLRTAASGYRPPVTPAAPVTSAAAPSKK